MRGLRMKWERPRRRRDRSAHYGWAPGMLASVHIHETTQVDLPDVLLVFLPLSCLATTCTG